MKLIAIYKEVEKLENRSSSKQAGRQAAKLVFQSDPCIPSFFLPVLSSGGIRPKSGAEVYHLRNFNTLQTANEPANVVSFLIS
jgi:hypothetical protein